MESMPLTCVPQSSLAGSFASAGCSDVLTRKAAACSALLLLRFFSVASGMSETTALSSFYAVHIHLLAIKLGVAARLRQSPGMASRWRCAVPSRCSAFCPGPLARCRRMSRRSRMPWRGASQPSFSPGRHRQSWQSCGPPSGAHSWPSGRSAPPAEACMPQSHN